MVSKRQRKINSKTAGNILTWSHYRFKMRLMSKAREYPNCRVIICGEEYTSQTCSECGYLHRKIGGSKKFKCPRCNQQSDRDFNAARNILLKNMSLVFRD
jgi:putative transposase